MDVSTATLRADGSPLADARVRGAVVAAAHSLAERTGVRIVRLDADASGLQVVLEGHEVVAVGFAAELRRITNAWWAAHHPGEELWPEHEVDEPDDDEGEDPDEGFGGESGGEDRW
jgi:hypothetical protein